MSHVTWLTETLRASASLLCVYYTVPQKKTVPTYILLLVCQIWTDFNKYWKHCPGQRALTKLTLKCPLHLKYVLALPWEIWSVRLSRQHNKTFEWLTVWRQTLTWLAVIVSQNKSNVSPHIIFITVCAQNVRLQHERKHVDAAPLAYSTFNNRVTQSGPLAVDVSFRSLTSEILVG